MERVLQHWGLVACTNRLNYCSLYQMTTTTGPEQAGSFHSIQKIYFLTKMSQLTQALVQWLTVQTTEYIQMAIVSTDCGIYKILTKILHSSLMLSLYYKMYYGRNCCRFVKSQSVCAIIIHLHLGLIFVDKARSLPVRGSTLVGSSSLDCKYQARIKVNGSGKHSSLL